MKETFLKAATSINKFFLALGADFVLGEQQNFTSLLEGYPNIYEEFQDSYKFAQENGLTRENPTTFTVVHCFADVAERALTTERHRDFTPKALLKKEGLLQ